MNTEPGCGERAGGTVLDFLVVIAEVCGRRQRCHLRLAVHEPLATATAKLRVILFILIVGHRRSRVAGSGPRHDSELRKSPRCWSLVAVASSSCTASLIGAAGWPYVRAIHFHFTARASTIGGRVDVIWVYLQVLLRTPPPAATVLIIGTRGDQARLAQQLAQVPVTCCSFIRGVT